MKNTIDMINRHKIIAIVRGVDPEDILSAARALYDGGIRLIEVTFNQSSSTGVKDTTEAIKALSEEFGAEMAIGAGTVVSEEQCVLAIEAGARYIISPNMDKSVITKTVEMGCVSIPGALSPSEVNDAYKAGAHFVKLFPAGVLGLSYIKAIKAPLNHIPMMAVGGVDDKNLKEFLDAGLSGVGIGSNIVNTKLIKEKRFSELTDLAKKYTTQI